MDPIHVEEPAVEVVPPAQTPEKDAIVASVTDDALVMAHEAQASTPSPEAIVKIWLLYTSYYADDPPGGYTVSYTIT